MAETSIKEKGKIVAGMIKKSFLDNMDLMSPYKRSHLAIRLFRASGNSEHNHHIKSNFDSIKEILLKDLAKHDNKEHVLSRSEVFFAELNKNNDRKGMERQKVFGNKKENLFYFRMIELAHIWNEMGFFDGEHASNHDKWLGFLGNKDLKSVILDDDVFKHYSAQLATFIYLLKFNGVADLIEEFKGKFFEVFMKDEELDEYMYKNKIYTLTHFIIGASNYYQNLVSAEKFGWVLDCFRKDINQILKRTNADIAAEIGICFRLAGVNQGKEIDLITEYLLKEFDAEKGYIPRLMGDHESSEHANSVAYLFLAGFDKLHKGPCFK